MNYDIPYFIKKFEAIPEERWCSYVLTDGEKHCALGHCGAKATSYKESKEELALQGLRWMDPRPDAYYVADINDGRDPDFRQWSPKQRILAWLKALEEFYR